MHARVHPHVYGTCIACVHRWLDELVYKAACHYLRGERQEEKAREA